LRRSLVSDHGLRGRRNGKSGKGQYTASIKKIKTEMIEQHEKLPVAQQLKSRQLASILKNKNG
jgi:hypothetical protein